MDYTSEEKGTRPEGTQPRETQTLAVSTSDPANCGAESRHSGSALISLRPCCDRFRSLGKEQGEKPSQEKRSGLIGFAAKGCYQANGLSGDSCKGLGSRSTAIVAFCHYCVLPPLRCRRLERSFDEPIVLYRRQPRMRNGRPSAGTTNRSASLGRVRCHPRPTKDAKRCVGIGEGVLLECWQPYIAA